MQQLSWFAPQFVRPGWRLEASATATTLPCCGLLAGNPWQLVPGAVAVPTHAPFTHVSLDEDETDTHFPSVEHV